MPFSLFRMSAEQGISAAQNHLASLYFRGLGVQKDEDAAKFWWGKSASQGDEVAVQCLANGCDCEEDDALS
jgi:TPR repeat protein